LPDSRPFQFTPSDESWWSASSEFARLESGKLWGKKKERKKKEEGEKKEYIHTHSYTQVVVHMSMYDGEEA
jgi:hypothetical protein